jgi:hypothetical protein
MKLKSPVIAKISGTDNGGDRSEVLGTEEINLVGHDDVGKVKTKR